MHLIKLLMFPDGLGAFEGEDVDVIVKALCMLNFPTKLILNEDIKKRLSQPPNMELPSESAPEPDQQSQPPSPPPPTTVSLGKVRKLLNPIKSPPPQMLSSPIKPTVWDEYWTAKTKKRAPPMSVWDQYTAEKHH